VWPVVYAIIGSALGVAIHFLVRAAVRVVKWLGR